MTRLGAAVLVAIILSLITLPPFTYPVQGSGAAHGLAAEPIVVDGEGYEWRHEMCHALDPVGDHRAFLGDYYDSRDIAAYYYAEGVEKVFFRIDFIDLAYGAETASNPDNGYSDALNIYLLIGWDNASMYQEWVPDFVKDYDGDGVHLPDYHWVLAIAIYDTGNYRVYRPDWSFWDQTNLSLDIAYSAQWDFIEISVPKSILEQYGWSSGSRIWAKIATTWVDNDGNNWLFDAAPNTISDGQTGVPSEWGGALMSDASVGTAKLVLLHHGNQHLTDNRALNPPDSPNSYGFILWVHEDVSERAGRPIPVMFHMSGTLLASYVWWDPGFIDYIRGLVRRGIAVPVGGVWAEYITAYFYDNFNAPSAKLAQDYYYQVFGYRPVTAWVPERTWDDERTGIAWTLSKYYKAVVLDGNTHHDDWADTNSLKPHKYDTSRTGGRPLYVFFIHWDTQQRFLDNTDGGLLKDLRILYLNYAMNSDQQQVFIYADDWEKAAGIAGWPVDPHRYENSVRWVAQHPWIQVTTIDEIVSWIETGSWGTVDGFYCGYDTYAYLKGWVNDYPYDYRRAYDGWYWGTSSEESFAWLGSGDPGYQLPDTTMPLGDVFGYTSYDGSPENTVLYRLLAPGMKFDSVPHNEFWGLTVYMLNAMLYETAWHEENDWDGDGLQDAPGWGRAQWNHVRLANVTLEAAKWLDDARHGRITEPGAVIGDWDLDGRSEAVIYSDRVFVYIDQRGGAAAYVFAYDPLSDRGFMAVGAPMVYWGTTENDLWWGSSHVGLFVDEYYEATNTTYHWRDYDIVVASANSTTVVVKAESPDVDGDGEPDIVKYYIVSLGENGFRVEYGALAGKLYVANGLSLDPVSTMIRGQGILEPINTPVGVKEFGYRNLDLNVYFTVKPVARAAYTGVSDWLTYTLQKVFKIAIYPGSIVNASIETMFGGYPAKRVVDGDPGDWRGTLPPVSDAYWYSGGEIVWRDSVGDEVTYFSSPDTVADIVEYRLTSDEHYLYMLIVFRNLSIPVGNGAPLIEIAFAPANASTGGTAFAGGMDYSVPMDKPWTRLIVVPLGSMNDPDLDDRYELIVYDPNWTNVAGTSDEASVSRSNNSVELRVSWSTLGYLPAFNETRIAVVAGRATSSDQAWDIPGQPDVIDTVSDKPAAEEAGDGVQDYFIYTAYNDIPEPVAEPPLYPIPLATALAAAIYVFLETRRRGRNRLIREKNTI